MLQRTIGQYCFAQQLYVGGRADDDLSPMIHLEEGTLAAWMMGALYSSPRPGLCLPLTRGYAGWMLDFFETYLEGKVIEIFHIYVRMPQYIAQKTSLRQIFKGRERETDPDVMSRELAKEAKRNSYDVNTKLLTFFLPGQAAAASWPSKTILFHG